ALGDHHLRNPRNQPVSFFLLDIILAISRAPVALRLLDDVADGLLKHANPDHSPRPPARPRHVPVLDDVHGHGSLRSLLRRSPGKPYRSTNDRSRRRNSLRPRCNLVRTRP